MFASVIVAKSTTSPVAQYFTCTDHPDPHQMVLRKGKSATHPVWSPISHRVTDDNKSDEEETEAENQYGGGDQDVDAVKQTEMRVDDEGEEHDDE